LITHIYVAKLKPHTPDEKIVAWLDAIRGLRIDGMLELTCGSDLRLREGNYDVAITADFENAEAWHRYNDDKLHNEIRAEHAKPLVADQRRVQFMRNRHFEVPGDIRNVTVIDLKEDAPAEQGTRIVQRLLELRCRGMHHLDAGIDLGLQTGNATVGVVCDFDTPEAYAVYDADELHNRIRGEDIKPHAEKVRRVQFELDADR
jgi:hypothetical protein